MPDFRIADTAPEHRKMRAAGPAAIGLWAMAGAYAMSPTQMTDGWVPLYWVQTWPAGKRLATVLVGVGLWQEADRDGIPGYQFHEWDERQRLASSVEDEKRKARERMQAIRSGSVRANKMRTSHRTTSERSPNVHDSLTLTPGGSVGGVSPVGRYAGTRDIETPLEIRPAERCPKHVGDPDPPNCGKCADQRRAVEKWDQQRNLAERMVIRACGLCDGDGYRLVPGRRIPMTPYVRCDHTREQALT